MKITKLTIISLASCLLVGCQKDERSPGEIAMERSQSVIYQANEGFRTQKLDESEIPFGDIAGEFGGESGGAFAPGGPEISSGGIGGPEISSGGAGTPDISRGGTGSPSVPRGGVGVPGGTGNYASAICEFVDVICERLVACSSDLSGQEAACSEIASICLPLVLELTASISVPPAAYIYLQCLTGKVRTSGCSIFLGEDGFVESVAQCLPGGFPGSSAPPDDDFGDFDTF